MDQENDNVQVADAAADPSVVQELEGMDAEEGENCTRALEVVPLSEEVTPASLKARPKVVKNTAGSSLRKGKKVKGASTVRRKFVKKKKGKEVKGEGEGVNNGSEEAKDGNLKKEDVQENENVLNEEGDEDGMGKENKEENEERIAMESSEIEKEKQVGEERIAMEPSEIEKEKQVGEERIAMEPSEIDKEKQTGEEMMASERKGKTKQGSDSKHGHLNKDSRNKKKKGKVEAKEKNENNRGKVEAKEKHENNRGKVEAKEKKEKNKGKVEAKEKNENNRGKVEAKEKNVSSEGKVEAKENNGNDKEMIEAKTRRERGGKKTDRVREAKKEKLGGLIFMCNARTKPDCFRYRVMGVSANKKDVVLDVKPGLKLFLYDFDLKLMYGIYEASSRGGMKLEPKAFGGSFPAQVRFRVYKDCFPIPESEFKKAIKENYDRKNRFNTELTVRQVRKLCILFRSVASQSMQPTAAPVPSSPITNIRGTERSKRPRERDLHPNRETFLRASPHVHPDRETFRRDSHEVRRLPVRSYDRHDRINFPEPTTQREEIRHDLFMSENEYRTYGLLGERRNLASPQHITSALESYNRDPEREHLIRQVDARYRDALSVHREAVAGPLYLNQRDLQVYDTGARGELLDAARPMSASTAISRDSYTRDPPYDYHHRSSLSAYLPPVGRDEVSVGSYLVDGGSSYLVNTNSLRRGETDQASRLYSTYDLDSLSSYNPARSYRIANMETALPPVSARYSFGGPSHTTYR